MAPAEQNDQIDAELIARGVAILKSGGLVAFPTDTLYALGADGFSQSAVERVLRAKGRDPDNPVPLLIASAESLVKVAVMVHPFVAALAKSFWPGPMTLVLSARPEVPDAVTAGTGTVGVRVPDHPVPIALIRGLGRPITGTSANRSGTPPTRLASEVAANLADSVDLVIPGRCGEAGEEELPSTVIDCTATPPRITRNGALAAYQVLRVIQQGYRDLESPGGESDSS
ncbi:MAG: threonylcarbamoyl-AMP synthase [Chloroflexi bacterium]|nr:threonylcarbamoyl-AMP synthase [Chloroflexota bacterium]